MPGESLQLRIEPTRVPCRCCRTCANLRDDEQRRTMAYYATAHATPRPCRFCGEPTFGLLGWAVGQEAPDAR